MTTQAGDGEDGGTIEVPKALVGQRVDRAVSLLTGCTRSDAARLVESGAVLVDDRPARRGADRLDEGSRLRIDTDSLGTGPGLEPDAGVDLAIVFEDDDVIVVDKPAALVVHPGAGGPIPTLVAGLLAHDPAIAQVGDPERPGIVHRLDKGTSGLLVVARSARAYEDLVAQLAGRTVGREYLAVVEGHLANDRGVVEAPIGRSRRRPTMQAVTADGRPARTRYTVERRADEPIAASVVQCRLDTGRTHQIRVHLSAIGHPVVGDDRYGAEHVGLIARPALHARRLSFEHPATGETMSFESPLPADLSALLERLV
jgi:23S rRNA pseudouridine1911/1915/1917 synthase